VIAQKNEYPAIERVPEDHGIVTFALAYDLVKAHSEGDVTIRQIASLTDLSPGTTYDLVEALYSILDLETTSRPRRRTHRMISMRMKTGFSRNTLISRPSDEDVYCEHCRHGDVSELGKHPSPHLQKLKSAVEDAGTEIWVPAAVYHELADTGSADSPTNPYLDTAIEEGWLRVAPSLPGDRTEGFDSSAGPVEKARFVADEFLNQQSKYPETNNWQDAALVALAVRLFDVNARIHVITHTADEKIWQRRALVSLPNSDITTSSHDTTTHPKRPRLSFQPLASLRGMSRRNFRDWTSISTSIHDFNISSIY